MLRFDSPYVRRPVFALALMLANAVSGAEPPDDPSVSAYGTLNPEAPAELATFRFLIGKWSGTATARNANGSSAQFPFDWIGRYVLDGMAIADEMRMPAAQGGAVQGLSLRYFDANRKHWSIEYLNFNGSFVRKQVDDGTGVVAQGRQSNNDFPVRARRRARA